MDVALDQLPGFRRRFRITPSSERICCEVEDDFHCMSLTVCHDGKRVIDVEPVILRAPWTTCPGAEQKLKETFAGLELTEFVTRGEKKLNCTHLYDLALLAASHVFDRQPTVYDILVSDPVDNRRRAELRRNGEPVLAWVESDFKILEPADLAGTPLFDMQAWISEQEVALQEAARLLRWGNMIANGRVIPLENQSDATKMPPSCYTFQPERAVQARRIGEIVDFGKAGREPLAN